MAKIRFSTRCPRRFSQDYRHWQRPKTRASATRIGIALDALDREQKAGNSIPDRVALLEKNLSAVLDLVVAFSEKMDEKFSEAGTVERDRMKSLLKLVEIQISEHDEAEQIRFYRLKAGLSKRFPVGERSH